MIIYKTTNFVNGKIYVGRDAKNNPNYLGSGIYYKRAEKKYGKENFKKAIIDSSEDFDELCLKEIFWIDKLDARNPAIGYNILPGGSAGGATRIGMKNSEESKQKTSLSVTGEKNGMYGKHMSDVARQKQRLSHLGRKPSEEAKQKMRFAKLGKSCSEETKRKISVSQKGIQRPYMVARWAKWREQRETIK